MDGLSGAASGFAVASFSIQLVGSIENLYKFWTSVKDAPEDINAISNDLSILSTVLCRIAHDAQQGDFDAILVLALDGCRARINILTAFIDKVEPGFASRSVYVRKWNALKAVIKHGQLRRFEDTLEKAKSTLFLVQQTNHR